MGYSKSNADVENAFMQGVSKKKGNSQTDGKILLLFGNRIAEHREDGVYITNCGWQTATTKAHLNLLPNVRIHQAKKIWYLNGEEWDGEWTKVSDVIVTQSSNNPLLFDETKTYIQTDGWRGYQQPVYAVCGANDTGMWEDSPCRTDVCLDEIKQAQKALGGIKSKVVVTETSNVFCVHRYLIVPPSEIGVAKERIKKWWEDNDKGSVFNLLYIVDSN